MKDHAGRCDVLRIVYDVDNGRTFKTCSKKHVYINDDGSETPLPLWWAEADSEPSSS